MRLTNYSNYALRMLQYARLRAPDLVRIEDVANAHNVSRHHLVKIAHQLGRHGYLETVRGRGGGIRLGRPAASITVGEIVRITETPIELVECFNADKNTCPLIGACRLSSALDDALEAFLKVLDGVTIADISGNQSQLADRLGLELAQKPA